MFGGRNEMITYEFANRKPGWLLAAIQYDLALEIHDLHAGWIIGGFNPFEGSIVGEAINRNLSLLKSIAPFDSDGARADIASTWARIELEFKGRK
jgi:hypothetical protein